MLVWNSLRSTLFDAVATAVRRTLPRSVGTVSWYGQQEAHRVGYYDTIRRCGLVGFGRSDNDLLDIQSVLTAATGGWWWAFRRVCVMAERPSSLHTEPAPDGSDGRRRLHHRDAAALEYRDNTRVFVHHGTIVPEWVVLDRVPSASDANATSRSADVRSSASAGIPISTRPGSRSSTVPRIPVIRLPARALRQSGGGWGGAPGRILLAVNGSSERDGTRRRYGLPVPAWVPTALDAAGWTYGISGSDYSRLVRRT